MVEIFHDPDITAILVPMVRGPVTTGVIINATGCLAPLIPGIVCIATFDLSG
jgi:hypothetical protein